MSRSFAESVYRVKTFNNFEKAIAKSISLNEISDSENIAFKLVEADKGLITSKSGYSFGANQLDMGGNDHARDVFVQIMNFAKDSEGKQILSRDFINDIAKFDDKGKLVGGVITAKGPDRKLTDEQISKINEAFSSDFAKDLLSREFIKELDKAVSHVKERINSTITNLKTKSMLLEDRSLIYLADYHNQFHFSPGGKIETFLIKSQNDQNFKTKDIANWVIEKTDYGQNYPFKIKTRHANIEMSCKEFGISHDESVIKEYQKEFARRRADKIKATLIQNANDEKYIRPSPINMKELEKEREKEKERVL